MLSEKDAREQRHSSCKGIIFHREHITLSTIVPRRLTPTGCMFSNWIVLICYGGKWDGRVWLILNIK